MAAIEYSLFRVKFIRPRQKNLFKESDLTPSELFLQAIDERPSKEVREGYKWHIGNVEMYSEATGYFAAGRTTSATVAKFDEDKGDFVEEDIETSPYTHCVFEAKLGLMGIAKKTILAPTTIGIASKIQLLFTGTSAVREHKIEVEILPVPDPDDFLKAVTSAWQVSKFTATFRGPNPFDADELFQKPLAVYLKEANGEQGKAEINGIDLDRDVVKEVARSTAATGNRASARIKKTKNSNSERRRNQATIRRKRASTEKGHQRLGRRVPPSTV